MKMAGRIILTLGLIAAASSAVALESAYNKGLRIAARHGYKNHECYATVFANYARYYPNARVRGWNFPFRQVGLVHTALWNECGIMR